MKKGLFIVVAALMVAFTAQAQNYMVVDTEKIFKAIPAYVQAIESLDKQSEAYTKQIEDAYAELDVMFKDYQSKKDKLPEATRAAKEEEIVSKERELIKYEEGIFSQEGTLYKKRTELIKPIQDKVFNAIGQYAKFNNFALVLDLASNPAILYYTPSADRTEEIIKLTK